MRGLKRAFEVRLLCEKIVNKLGVEWRVFWHRLALICRFIPHLWTHYRDFDSETALRTFRFRLERLERVLSNDEVHSDSEERAADLRRFLQLLNSWENAFDLIPKPEGAESGFREEEPIFFCNDICREWYRQIDKLEEESWKAAWDLFRDKGREWWS